MPSTHCSRYFICCNGGFCLLVGFLQTHLLFRGSYLTQPQSMFLTSWLQKRTVDQIRPMKIFLELLLEFGERCFYSAGKVKTARSNPKDARSYGKESIVRMWGGSVMARSSEYLDLAAPEAAGSDGNTDLTVK